MLDCQVENPFTSSIQYRFTRLHSHFFGMLPTLNHAGLRGEFAVWNLPGAPLYPDNPWLTSTDLLNFCSKTGRIQGRFSPLFGRRNSMKYIFWNPPAQTFKQSGQTNPVCKPGDIKIPPCASCQVLLGPFGRAKSNVMVYISNCMNQKRQLGVTYKETSCPFWVDSPR